MSLLIHWARTRGRRSREAILGRFLDTTGCGLLEYGADSRDFDRLSALLDSSICKTCRRARQKALRERERRARAFRRKSLAWFAALALLGCGGFAAPPADAGPDVLADARRDSPPDALPEAAPDPCAPVEGAPCCAARAPCCAAEPDRRVVWACSAAGLWERRACAAAEGPACLEVAPGEWRCLGAPACP